MTKNFIIVAILAMLALSCQRPKNEESGKAAAPDNEKILSNISYNLDSGYTKDGLSDSIWKEMVQNYKPHAGKDVQDNKKQNTRSVWFHLDTLIRMVELLKAEREALQKGDTTKKDSVTDGVRIYFGRYKTHPKHKERNTLIFVSTFWVEKEKGHKDYLNNILDKSEAINNGELSPPNNFGVSWDSHID